MISNWDIFCIVVCDMLSVFTPCYDPPSLRHLQVLELGSPPSSFLKKTPPSYAGGWGLGGRMEPWGVGLTFGMAGSFDRCPTVTFPGGDRQRRGRQNKATRRKDPSSSRRGTKNPGIINAPQSEQKGSSGLG
ncbi:hypothetical protein CSPX01_09882 [Colletotrichum filicis]|nr:hypothetical protein CSPX01_09882 [Colletotrichum filicis]